jgi:putative membrane protein
MDEEVVAPSTQALLSDWNWAPSIIVGLLLFYGAFLYGLGPLRRRHKLGPPASRQQLVYLGISFIILVFALVSPLDAIGDSYLFSAHMVQHLLLAALWPPFLLLATPGWLLRSLFKNPVFSSLMLFLTYPAVAILLFNVDIYLWHLPALYNLTLTNETVHIAEHLTFMAFGVTVWWPVLSPLHEQRLEYPLQLLYLFANGMFMMVLGILFTFAPTPFYSPYVAAPRLWGMSAATDQQLGGLVMWYPGNIPYAVALVVAFYRWFDSGQASPGNQRFQSPTIGPPGP